MNTMTHHSLGNLESKRFGVPKRRYNYRTGMFQRRYLDATAARGAHGGSRIPTLDGPQTLRIRFSAPACIHLILGGGREDFDPDVPRRPSKSHRFQIAVMSSSRPLQLARCCAKYASARPFPPAGGGDRIDWRSCHANGNMDVYDKLPHTARQRTSSGFWNVDGPAFG